MLKDKASMDKEAEKRIHSIKSKVRTALNLFLRNRNTGTTSALKAAIAHSNSPLILSGNTQHGRKILKDMLYDSKNQGIQDKLKDRATVVSWNSIGSMGGIKKSKGRSVQLIPDNSFMIRALDSIYSAIDFLVAEYKRVKQENKTLRQSNKRLANASEDAHKRVENMKKTQEELKDRIDKLQDKLDSERDGK